MILSSSSHSIARFIPFENSGLIEEDMASSNSKEKDEDQKKLFPLSTGAYLEQLHNLWARKALCDAVVTADGR